MNTKALELILTNDRVKMTELSEMNLKVTFIFFKFSNFFKLTYFPIRKQNFHLYFLNDKIHI